ncbi:hypothetical protein [Methylobacter marinus]
MELSRNFGKEGALTTGIDASTGDVVMLILLDIVSLELKLAD